MPERPDTIENGERFPELDARTTDGEEVRLPDFVEGDWSILLFYRGHW